MEYAAPGPEPPANDTTPVRVQVRNMAGDVVVSITERMLPRLQSTVDLTLYVLKATDNELRWGKFLTVEDGELPAENWQSRLPQDAKEALELTLVVAALPVIDRSTQTLAETLEAIKARLELPALPVQRDAMMQLRKILSIERDPPIDEVIEAGLLALALPLCEAEDADLRYEALWAITNVASGSSAQCRELIDEGALPRILAGLGSQEVRIKEQAIWAVGNIAGDSPALRDLVIGAGAVPLLCSTLQTSQGHVNLARNTAWTISNLFRGRPEPPREAMQPLLQPIAQVVMSSVITASAAPAGGERGARDEPSEKGDCEPAAPQAVLANADMEMLRDLVWALSYASDGPDEKIQAVLETGVVPSVVKLLGLADLSTVTPALRMVGNVATGTQEQTQAVIDAGALPGLKKLLSCGKQQVRKEALWTLSNITAGSQDQVQAFIDEGLIPLVAEALAATGVLTDESVRKEAAYTLANFCDGGSHEQIQALVEQRAVPAMLRAVDTMERGMDVGPPKETAVRAVLLLMQRMSGLDISRRNDDWCVEDLKDFFTRLQSDEIEGVNLDNFEAEIESAQNFLDYLDSDGGAKAVVEAEAEAQTGSTTCCG